MGEHEAIKNTRGLPATIESIKADLRALGLEQGMVLLVHSSLSSLGWVSGGPVAVILALEEVLGPQGTLVMPSHSGDLSDPERWQNPPVPETWWQIIRESMPAYDPDLTPTRMMGRICEAFRKQPGVLRSGHPQVSFTARGPQAAFITEGHELDFGLGENSPLARIYELGGQVLFLGVGFSNNTSFHLAEMRAEYPSQEKVMTGAPILQDGRRKWVQFQDINIDDSDFCEIGERFIVTSKLVRQGKVGEAECMLMPQVPMVDFAVKWMSENRKQ
jgi:aminoglycoside 3-N-acetyltransferase